MELAVIKIGGHLISPEGEVLDIEYVKKLVKSLKEALSLAKRLVVVVGGGQVARRYITAGRQLGLNEGILDRLGIEASRMNALFLSYALHGINTGGVPSTIDEISGHARTSSTVFVGGLEPGQSTTTVAALIAESLQADKLVIATNVDGIYNSDPRVNPQARKMDYVSISTLEEMFMKRSLPAGGYELLDPVTIKILKRSKIDTVVVNGRPPGNIIKAMKGERIGTTVIFEEKDK